MRPLAWVMIVAVALPGTDSAWAQQKGRPRGRHAAGAQANQQKLALPQSGSRVASGQNTVTGSHTPQIPARPRYRPPEPPKAPPVPQVRANTPTPRTRGYANPQASVTPRRSYSRHSPVGGRRLRTVDSATVKAQINRNRMRFSGNAAINNRFFEGF